MHVDSAVNEVGDGLVKPVIVIKEGPRVVVGSVTMSGNQAIPTDRLTPLLTLKVGDPYYGPAVARDRDALLVTYLNAGYASAEVTVPPVVPVTTPDGARADVVFKIVEGPQTIVEHIFITGNLRTKPSVIQRELQIKPGSPLGLEDLTESRRRLSALGLFRRIQISAISHGDPSLRDVVVTVEEAPQTTIGGGGGLEIDRRLPPVRHRRDRDRRLRIRAARLLRDRPPEPRRTRSLREPLYEAQPPAEQRSGRTANLFGFAEYRVVGTYREPRAFGTLRRPGRHGGGRAGRADRLQLQPEGIQRGADASALADDSRQRALLVRDDASLRFRRDATDDGSARPSTACFRRSGCPRSPRRSRATRATTCWSRRAARCSARTARSRPGRIGSEVGFIKTFLQGFVYKNLGRPQPRAGRRRAARPRQGVPARRATASTRTAIRCWSRGAGSAGERAILRRRRHDDSRLLARFGRRARDDYAGGLPDEAATRRSC